MTGNQGAVPILAGIGSKVLSAFRQHAAARRSEVVCATYFLIVTGEREPQFFNVEVEALCSELDAEALYVVELEHGVKLQPRSGERGVWSGQCGRYGGHTYRLFRQS